MNLHDVISIIGAVLGLISAGAVWGALRQRVAHLEEAEKKRNGRAEGALTEKVDRHEEEIKNLRRWRHDIGDAVSETVAAAELRKRGLSVPPPRRRT